MVPEARVAAIPPSDAFAPGSTEKKQTRGAQVLVQLFTGDAGLYNRILREVEKPLIEQTLDATRGNQIRAAEVLGLNRNTLRKKIRDLDIEVIRGLRRPDD